jgi:hypothetical protein
MMVRTTSMQTKRILAKACRLCVSGSDIVTPRMERAGITRLVDLLLLEFRKTLIYSPKYRVSRVSNQKRCAVKQLWISALLVLAVSGGALAQGKGVDKQSERVRDTGGDKTAGVNGSKTNTGTGRGMDWGKDKTQPVPLLPNPYRLTGRRDVIIKAVQDVMRDRKLVVDDAASRLSDGIIVSQPYRFIKGAVVTQSELGRYADAPTSTTRGWTQGRYTITVEVQPIDGVNSNISVNAKIEGRTDGATGAEWVTLPSLGVAEDEFLAALVEAVTGVTPPGRQPATNP